MSIMKMKMMFTTHRQVNKKIKIYDVYIFKYYLTGFDYTFVDVWFGTITASHVRLLCAVVVTRAFIIRI